MSEFCRQLELVSPLSGESICNRSRKRNEVSDSLSRHVFEAWVPVAFRVTRGLFPSCRLDGSGWSESL